MSRGTQDAAFLPTRFGYGGLALCARPSHAVRLRSLGIMPPLNPGGPKAPGLGSSLFARRYWGNLS